MQIREVPFPQVKESTDSLEEHLRSRRGCCCCRGQSPTAHIAAPPPWNSTHRVVRVGAGGASWAPQRGGQSTPARPVRSIEHRRGCRALSRVLGDKGAGKAASLSIAAGVIPQHAWSSSQRARAPLLACRLVVPGQQRLYRPERCFLITVGFRVQKPQTTTQARHARARRPPTARLLEGTRGPFSRTHALGSLIARL
jgi:hypothetical protein